MQTTENRGRNGLFFSLVYSVVNLGEGGIGSGGTQDIILVSIQGSRGSTSSRNERLEASQVGYIAFFCFYINTMGSPFPLSRTLVGITQPVCFSFQYPTMR